MRQPSETDLLALWETGHSRHPIDRALLLCAWARPELAADRFAHLPLGAVNTDLLKMRARLFGNRVVLQCACGECGELLEVPLVIDELLGAAEASDARAEVTLAGFRFRVPDSRDLASVVNELDAEAAALRLLENCCIERPSAGSDLASVLTEASERLEAADTLADLKLAVTCTACGHRWEAGFDPGDLLWNDVRTHARKLLAQVHTLARAYGWTEPDVLALSPARRAAYLDMAFA
jgi:hypothetical protein